MLPRNPWRVIYFWLLLFLPLAGTGQEYIIRHRILSVEEGLSSRFVRKVLQDKHGFIWIATSEALNRYDGLKVLSYSKEQHGLPTNDINLLYEGPNGLLWVGNYGFKEYGGLIGGEVKLSFFDPITEQTYSFRDYFGDKAPFGEEELFGLYVDDNRMAWLGTYSGKAYLYDGDRFTLLVDNKGAHPISYVLPADENSFWLLGPAALLRVDSSGNTLERDRITGYKSFPYRITLLKNGGVQLQAYWYFLLKYRGQKLNKQYRLPNGDALDVSPYWKIQETSDGRLWCFQNDDLHIFDAGGKRLAALSEKRHFPEQFSLHPPFASFFIDSDGLAWKSLDEGLLLLDVRENIFRPYLKKASLRGMIQLAADTILAATYDGFYKLALSSGVAMPLFEGETLYGMGLLHSSEGEMWFALNGNKALRLSQGSGSLEEFRLKNKEGIPVDPLYPFIDSSGRLWMGTDNGLAHYDEASGQFAFDEAIHEYLGGKSCTWLCESEEGLWAGSSEGVFLISPERTQIQHIDELPPFYISHIFRESPRRFWLSCRGGGLIRWDRDAGSFRQFTIEDGLSSNIVYAAYPDERGFLWLPSHNGLMLFDTASHLVQTFKELHGLPSNEFNAYSHLRLDDGRLLLGTISGLASFVPQEIAVQQRENTELNVLKVEQFDSKGGTTEDVTARFREQGFLELTSRRRYAVFHFFLNDYFQPEDNRYFYMVEGIDPGWQIMTGNQVPIGQMPYGQYTLRVRAMGQDGYWAGNDLAIPLFSMRPFYIRWWFILTAALMITCLATLLFRLRLWQLKRSKALLEAEVARRLQQIERDRRTIAEQKAHLETLNAAKDKLFSIVGHELRGPLMYFGNIANRIRYALEKKDFDKLADLGNKAQNLASSTNNMLNNLLNWSLLESGRLSFGKGPADAEAVIGQAIEAYREMASLKQLSLDLEATPGLSVQVGKDGLAILLQNLLSNAIKFTPEGGGVTLRAYRENGRAVISVQDSGKGMDPEKLEQLFSLPFQPASPGTAGERGAGLGLQIVQEILRRYDGELKVKSREGRGSTFTILLPLERNDG